MAEHREDWARQDERRVYTFPISDQHQHPVPVLPDSKRVFTPTRYSITYSRYEAPLLPGSPQPWCLGKIGLSGATSGRLVDVVEEIVEPLPAVAIEILDHALWFIVEHGGDRPQLAPLRALRKRLAGG